MRLQCNNVTLGGWSDNGYSNGKGQDEMESNRLGELLQRIWVCSQNKTKQDGDIFKNVMLAVVCGKARVQRTF